MAKKSGFRTTTGDRANAEGEASSSAREHIERCPFCQKEASGLRADGRDHERSSVAAVCLPAETLGEYAMAFDGSFARF